MGVKIDEGGFRSQPAAEFAGRRALQDFMERPKKDEMPGPYCAVGKGWQGQTKAKIENRYRGAERMAGGKAILGVLYRPPLTKAGLRWRQSLSGLGRQRSKPSPGSCHIARSRRS